MRAPFLYGPLAMIATLFFNRQHGLRNGWWILAFFVVLGVAIVGATLLLTRGQPVPAEIQLALVAATTVLLQALRRKPLAEITGAPDRRALQGLLLGLAAGAVLMALPALFLLAGGWVRFSANVLDLRTLLAGLLAALTVAALEELVFRGFMFRRLQDGVGLPLTLLLTSAYFVLTHMGNPGMTGSTRVLAGVNIFVASLLFGLALVRSGGLAMPIGLHAMANFTQGSIFGFGVSGNATPGLYAPALDGSPVWLTGGAFGLEASVPGLVVLAAMTAAVYAWRGLPDPHAT